MDTRDADNTNAEPTEGSLDEQIESLQRERDEVFARLQRVAADYQNYQKRAEANLRDSIEHARADMLRQFIGVLDYFEHALSVTPTTSEARGVYDGVRIVRDELLKVMQQAGVERIEPKIGDEFDPHRHEAMLRQSAAGIEPNHISAVLQPGYSYGQRTLRPAKVAVAPAE